MSERNRNTGSGFLAEEGSRSKRNFVDSVLLSQTTDEGVALFLSISGLGALAAGFGIGAYFFQKGEAEKIRAEKEVREENNSSQERPVERS